MPRYKTKSKAIIEEAKKVVVVPEIERISPVVEKVEEAETVHVVPKEEVVHQAPIVPTNQLFPLNFIQLPLGTFGLDSSEPIVHPTYKKLLDDTLVNYRFHSFAVSHGMFILAFELK